MFSRVRILFTLRIPVRTLHGQGSDRNGSPHLFEGSGVAQAGSLIWGDGVAHRAEAISLQRSILPARCSPLHSICTPSRYVEVPARSTLWWLPGAMYHAYIMRARQPVPIGGWRMLEAPGTIPAPRSTGRGTVRCFRSRINQYDGVWPTICSLRRHQPRGG